MTIAQENAAARAKAGVRTITHEQLKALTDSTPTALKTASNVYANPPDGYAEALKVLGVATPQPSLAPSPSSVPGRIGFTTAQTEKNSRNTIFILPPDGYRIALDTQRRASTTTPPTPVSTSAPDGYQLALDEQRKEK